jgi:hypothetical protein
VRACDAYTAHPDIQRPGIERKSRENKELALMRRITLVLALAAIMSMTMVLAGQSLARTTNQNQISYTDTINGFEYFADPANGIAKFRGAANGDLEGALDGTVHYTGTPAPNVTNTITGGTWILCSRFQAPPLDPITRTLITPQCTTDSSISLMGTWSGGTVRWDATGLYGVAEVKGLLTVTGGTVKGMPVSGGSGKFEGTLDHTPLLTGGRPKVNGTVVLKF